MSLGKNCLNILSDSIFLGLESPNEGNIWNLVNNKFYSNDNKVCIFTRCTNTWNAEGKISVILSVSNFDNYDFYLVGFANLL